VRRNGERRDSKLRAHFARLLGKLPNGDRAVSLAKGTTRERSAEYQCNGLFAGCIRTTSEHTGELHVYWVEHERLAQRPKQLSNIAHVAPPIAASSASSNAGVGWSRNHPYAPCPVTPRRNAYATPPQWRAGS